MKSRSLDPNYDSLKLKDVLEDTHKRLRLDRAKQITRNAAQQIDFPGKTTADSETDAMRDLKEGPSPREGLYSF